MATSPRILNRQHTSDAESLQKAPVAVHHRSACSGVKALRNTSTAKRQAAKPWLAFRSLDPFRALREPDRRRRDEERLFRSEQKTGNKPKRLLDRKAPYKSSELLYGNRLSSGTCLEGPEMVRQCLAEGGPRLAALLIRL